jgi:endonuclease YncB( thermonuclease family)
MSSRTASSRRAPAKRQTSKKSTSNGGMTSWLVILGIVAGGIALYDNRAAALRELSPLLSDRKPAASRTEAKAEPRRQQDTAKAQSVPTATKTPIPPADVGVVKAAIPASRPAVATGTGGPLTGENFSGKFYFCGTSGLDNCVMSGDTFWYKKTKVALADIAAPRTDGAACQQERDRGFAAKVRLKDLLSSGRFDLETLNVAGPGAAPGVMRVVTRNGRSLGSILVSEGLAKPRMARQQSWCP